MRKCENNIYDLKKIINLCITQKNKEIFNKDFNFLYQNASLIYTKKNYYLNYYQINHLIQIIL